MPDDAAASVILQFFTEIPPLTTSLLVLAGIMATPSGSACSGR